MSLQTNKFYDFGDFRLDVGEQVLFQAGQPVPITPKVFDTLCVLIEKAGHTVSKDQLMEQIWGDRFVEESNLTFNVKMLRRALGDDAQNPKFIETIPRRGYRFIAEVRGVPDSTENAVNSNGGAILNGNPVDLSGDTVGTKAPEHTRGSSRRKMILYLIGSAALICLVAAGVLWFKSHPSFYQRFAGLGFLNVEKLTDTGTALNGHISSDGRFLAYHTDEGGRSTLWLRQLANGNTMPLLTLANEFISGHHFSADGEYIYFAYQSLGKPLTLNRIPTLGGPRTQIITGVHGWTFSPDERQIAFLRIDGQGSHVIVADNDGQNEREIFLSPKGRSIHGLDWSPDGRSIGYCVGSLAGAGGGKGFGIYQIGVADGIERTISDLNWSFVENLEWLPDQSGLLVTGREKPEETVQVWLVSYPEGKTIPITRDSFAVSLNSATADFSRLIATQKRYDGQIWTAPANDLSSARPIGQAEFEFAWTNDSKLIFPARSTSRSDLWLINPDGSDKRQMTVSDSLKRSPAVSPDGRQIIYVSTQNGARNIWRMDADGANQAPLTSGTSETFPTFTPDGKWVVFTSDETGTLWKVPAEGGEAIQICAERVRRVGFSPSGDQFAYLGRNKENKPKLIVRNFPDCSFVREFDAALITASIQKVVWSKDGKTILYTTEDAAFVGNIWQQSLAGGEPQKLSNFTSEGMTDFEFSPDGTQIAFVRGNWRFDVVLLKGP